MHSGDGYLEIQISGSLVILQLLPGAVLNKKIKGKGVIFFFPSSRDASLFFKAELELSLPTWRFTVKFLSRASVPRSPDGA